VIALRRPEDYSPNEGARFEIHFEKLRNRIDGGAALPFEARLETINVEGREALFWIASNLKPPFTRLNAAATARGSPA
jgi:putative DNA primase/helicase